MIYFLIFLSGAAGLVYEMAWIRQASFVFGSSALALSTVLAVFFLGLSIGSWAFGRLGVAIRRPLLVCAGLEFLLALNALSSPALFAWADAVYGELYQRQLSPMVLLLLRGGLVSLLLLPPTVLMGGTLPLFCRQLIQETRLISVKLSVLYGTNTLGAACGCAVTGFVLLPMLGLRRTLYVLAAMNVLAGVGFCWAAYSKPCWLSSSAPSKTEPDVATDYKRFLYVGVLFFMIGAAALAYELVWARFLTLFIRHSVYTYALTLSVVLVGMAVGSFGLGLGFTRLAEQRANPRGLLMWFFSLQVLSGVVLVGLTHLPAGFWQHLQQSGVWHIVLLMMPSAIISGACFPLLNQLASNDAALAAKHVGFMGGINIVGCVLGSLLTGFYLLPQWGLDASIYALTAWTLAAALLALWVMPTTYSQPKPWLAWSGLGMAGAVLGYLWVFAPVRIPQDYMRPTETVLDFAEGYNSNLAVVQRNDEKVLLIDRLWQGVASRNYQVMVAHIPMLHFPEAQSVLVVGLGAGNTASRFLDYPISQLDIVDIEPRLFAFTKKHFPSAWMADKRVTFMAEDGRNYVRHTASQYDFISVEIGQLDRPGVGVFYTEQFYQEAKAKLSAEGMVCQFVPLSFLRPEEFASILSTFLAVFPKAQLWYNTNELLLMGFKQDIKPLSPERFAQVTTTAPINSDFELYYWGGFRYKLNQLSNFMGNFLASGDELRALAASAAATVYSDDKLQLAYSASVYKRGDKRASMIVPLLQQHLTPIAAALTDGAADANTLDNAAAVRDLNVADIAAEDSLWVEQPDQETTQERYQRAQAALRHNPKNSEALGLLMRARYEMSLPM
ncbi:MAG: fused MFS/spermidine synthase [Methylococcaceae bacterium]|nr:fused MFS/spermidine synthase [Methylococcaceae bacterium]